MLKLSMNKRQKKKYIKKINCKRYQLFEHVKITQNESGGTDVIVWTFHNGSGKIVRKRVYQNCTITLRDTPITVTNPIDLVGRRKVQR